MTSHVALLVVLSNVTMAVTFFGLTVRTGTLGIEERENRLLSDWHFRRRPAQSRSSCLGGMKAEEPLSWIEALHLLSSFVRRVPGTWSFILSLTLAGHEPIFIHDDPKGVSWTGGWTNSLRECTGLIALSDTISIRQERKPCDKYDGSRLLFIVLDLCKATFVSHGKWRFGGHEIGNVCKKDSDWQVNTSHIYCIITFDSRIITPLFLRKQSNEMRDIPNRTLYNLYLVPGTTLVRSSANR